MLGIMHCMHAYLSCIFLVINIGNSTKKHKTFGFIFANQVSDTLTHQPIGGFSKWLQDLP